MNDDPPGVSDDNGPDLQQTYSQLVALLTFPDGSLEAKPSQPIDEHIGQRAHQQSELIRPPRMA